MQAPLQNWKQYKLGYTFRMPTFYSKFHFGVDFICPEGTAVFAPEDGKANYFTGSQAGTAIYLKVNENRIHRLMHLSSRLVYNGKEVDEGELLGYSGNTGLSTGSHLHYDIYNDKGLSIENFIDPLKELNLSSMPTIPLSLGEFSELCWRYHGPKMNETDILWWYREIELGKKTVPDVITEFDRSETARNWKKEIEKAFADQTLLEINIKIREKFMKSTQELSDKIEKVKKLSEEINKILL